MTLFISPPRQFSQVDSVITKPTALDFLGVTVVFFHAHPDDESIFTGATMRRLADAGARIVLVMATDGALGGPDGSSTSDPALAKLRHQELELAAEQLGIARIVHLGHRDSGMAGWQSNNHPQALMTADETALAQRLAAVCEQENAAALVHYDNNGIYGHPDHVAVHRIGRLASGFAGIADYESTVDREHLHFAGEHLVARASRDSVAPYGRVTAEIALAVAANDSELAAKQAAMAAHESQIFAATLSDPTFRDTYQLEWYLRYGPQSILDRLGNVHAIYGGNG